MMLRALVILICAVSSALAVAEPMQVDPTRIQWSKLDYGASVFFIGLDATVELKEVSRTEADKLLSAAGNATAIPAASPSTLLLNINTKFLNQRNENQLWLNPDGVALQRSSLSTGKKLRYRRYRFSETGAYSLKRHPRSGEQEKSFNEWTDTTEDFYPYDAAKVPLAITDSQALLYLAGAAHVQQPGDSLTFAVFTKTGLGKATFTARERVIFRVDFEEVTKQGRNRITGNVDALRCVLSVGPLNANDPVEDFDLLGLSGDLEVHLDPQRGVVLQLSGKAKVVGSLDIKLERIVLR